MHFVFQSCPDAFLHSYNVAIPLIALASQHPKCTYNWENLEIPGKEFPNSPVIFVKDPCLYKCVVKQSSMIESHVFSVQAKVKDNDIDNNMTISPMKIEPTSVKILRIPPPQCEFVIVTGQL